MASLLIARRPWFWRRSSVNPSAKLPAIDLGRRSDWRLVSPQVSIAFGHFIMYAFHAQLMSEVTRILEAMERGEVQAADELLPLVYDELRRLANFKMAHESANQTLQPTALVHEAWLRLAGDGSQRWENRGHFFAAAAEAMRRILIDRARRRQCIRHGGDLERVDIEDAQIVATAEDERLLQVHEALDRLALEDPLKSDVVKMRFFVGMTDREVADVLGLSERTVERHWSYAKAWLFRSIRESA
jgi:RNA polymerase sigma factor (TIGR02999 family)